MIDYENASIEALTDGYSIDRDNTCTCLLCGKAFEQGEVFPFNDRFFDAAHAIKLHLDMEHPERFAEFINTEIRYLSLTDHQRQLLILFHEGLSDGEIAKRQSVSPSTIRHQRFVFREKAKEAKLYSAMWNMVEKNRKADLLPVHKGATMVDERYEISEEENKKIINDVFLSLDPLKLKVFSKKEKKKIVTLRKIAEKFNPGITYTEKEVNAILGAIYSDFATLRRYLIEYGFMERTKNCSAYWLK